MSRTRLGTVALVLAATCTASAFLLDLQVPGSHRDHLELIAGGPDSLTGLILTAAGVFVLRRLPEHALGWLLTGFGLWWAFDSLAASWLGFATLQHPARVGASTAFWIYQRLGSGLLLLLPLVLLLYPDGRLPRGRWRVAGLVSLATTALLPLSTLLVPSSVAQPASGAGELAPELQALDLDPFTLPLPDAAWEAVLAVAYPLVPLSLLVPFVMVVVRYRTATGLRRTRMRWLLWAAVVDVLVMLSLFLLPDDISSVGLTACIAVTATSVAIGLVRPDVIDVDVLLGNTLVYGVLLALAFVVDVLVLGVVGNALGSRFDRDEALVVAVFVVALLYAPLRDRLWRIVRRTVLGERDDPYRVVSGLAERLESSDTPEVQLLEVARSLGRAFRTSYVGVEVDQVNGARLLVEDGVRPPETHAMPITYRDETIGRLLLPDSSRGSTLRRSDARLLADVVRQAATAARATQLASELQASRLRLVTAVEDERRRLRNELHDGLGPTLAAIASRIDTARITARRAPEDSDRMLGLAREEITGLLAEVRRLVHGLRPPALDDVGLAGALRQQVERMQSPGLTVRLDVDPALGSLPAAVEVAAYRIVNEALTNVIRHASATCCTVRVSRGDELLVEVEDDGRGIADTAVAGVGLVSLRERAGELGGTCTVTTGPHGGTIVRASLPLAPEEGEG